MDFFTAYWSIECHAGEGRQGLVADDPYTALGVDLIGYSIEHNHLTVEVIEGPQAKIPMLLYFREGYVLFKYTLNKGVDW